jgi:hypothetical protein
MQSTPKSCPFWKVWKCFYWVSGMRQGIWGSSTFCLVTPLFDFQISLYTPEIRRRIYSSRLEFSWMPRSFIYIWGERLFRYDFVWVWKEYGCPDLP